MAFKKKTWLGRIAEYPNRRRLTKEDGSSELVTVSREEGQISQEGDAFSPDNFNDLEKRISEGFDDVNQSMNTKLDWDIIFSGVVSSDGYKWFKADKYTEVYVVVLDANNYYHPFIIPTNQFTSEARNFSDGIVTIRGIIGAIALITGKSMAVCAR